LAALAGFAGFFFWRHRQSGGAMEIYTSVADAKIPRISAEMYGRRMNLLCGHTENEKDAAGRTDLTILPEDRQLTLDIDPDGTVVTGLRYEIRNVAGDHLIERTDVSQFGGDSSLMTAVLPIQNMISADVEYSMTILLTVEDGRQLYYYTRILAPSGQDAKEMVDFAADFSDKTFDPAAARDLTTYLEVSDSADNSSLGDITLANNFDMLTWHDTGMRKDSDTAFHLRELMGSMCVLELKYTAARDTDSRTVYYDVTESYTLRRGTERVYVMDFNRKVREVFTGDSSAITSGQVTLGVSDGEEISAKKSPSGTDTAFSANGDLWVYDQKGNTLTRVYSTREDDRTVGEDYENCLVKALTVTDTGDVNFFVSGYQSRGAHAGQTGTTLYHYSGSGNTLSELLYLPSTEAPELLMEDAGTLAYLTTEGKFCLLMNGTVYRMGTDSSEAEVLAEGLSRDTFAASSGKDRIAWQEGGDRFGCEAIHVLSLEDGTDNVISAGDGEKLRLAGFVGGDVVYGIGRTQDAAVSQGQITSLPLYSVVIVDPGMQPEVTYQKENIYITGITISDSRVHLSRVSWDGSSYQPISEDTLINNQTDAAAEENLVGTSTDRTVGRVYTVQAAGIRSTAAARTPAKAQARADDETAVSGGGSFSGFLAYSRGRFAGSFPELSSAVAAVYDSMGLVTDASGYVLWNRIDRPADASSGDAASAAASALSWLKEFTDGNRVSADGTRLLDGHGLSLAQVMYFLGRGLPVAVRFPDGSVGVLTGYDQFNNVTFVRNADSGNTQTEKLGQGDASAFFAQNGNNFVCFLRTGGD
jgi:hypothetical protein